jgi:hypothetical protein
MILILHPQRLVIGDMITFACHIRGRNQNMGKVFFMHILFQIDLAWARIPLSD